MIAVAPSKIEIVPNGVDEFFSPGGDESDYVLFTGTLEPRKGIDDLLDACGRRLRWSGTAVSWLGSAGGDGTQRGLLAERYAALHQPRLAVG